VHGRVMVGGRQEASRQVAVQASLSRLERSGGFTLALAVHALHVRMMHTHHTHTGLVHVLSS
jgi:hypothetical protein